MSKIFSKQELEELVEASIKKVAEAAADSAEFGDEHKANEAAQAFVGSKDKFILAMIMHGLNYREAQYLGQLAALGGMLVALHKLRETKREIDRYEANAN